MVAELVYRTLSGHNEGPALGLRSMRPRAAATAYIRLRARRLGDIFWRSDVALDADDESLLSRR
jgi:hypothetical protein